MGEKFDIAMKALEKIKGKAYALAIFNPDEETGRKAWDIFWVAVAGLEGRAKASALDTFTALSGVPTDDPQRILREVREGEEFIWTTREGKEIPLSEIEDEHLRNIERMMSREMSACGRAGCMMRGEMALISIDRELSGMRQDYNIICVEIKRRNLPPPVRRKDRND